MVLVVVLAGSSLTGGSGGSNSLDDLFSVSRRTDGADISSLP